jgi:NAD(P)H-nitrite reductase large subunit
MRQVVIIGNGISGITAARNIRKRSDAAITVISSETEYFYSRTALMYVYMGHMTFEHTKPYEDKFWKKNRITLVFDHASSLEVESKSIHLKSGKIIRYDSLIIATGSSSNTLNVEGSDAEGVQTLYSYQDLLKLEANTRGVSRAVIVGGGLIGVELAEMLHTRKIDVTLLVREPAFWSNVLPIEEAQMISRHLTSHGVTLRHEEELSGIKVNVEGKVQAVLTKSGDKIPCELVAIAVGVHPNVGFLNGSQIKVNRGILVNRYLETNVPDVYAIGDCVERTYSLEGRNNIEQVWYTARMMGEAVAQTICGESTPYEPGPWFNSAKFFNIEFQTYGHIPNKFRDEHQDLYWEHSNGNKAVHLVWNSETREFLGINAFGIRLRHQKFDAWLRERKSIEFVLKHLPEANFDPEFTERHEERILELFKSKQLIHD